VRFLTSTERSVIESCVFDSRCTPRFELVRECLIWPDEQPESVLRLRGAAYELVGDLWIVRGLIHRGLPIEKWGAFGGEEFLATWNECLMGGLRWIGFRRIALTAGERAQLETNLESS
jgi:hypothetical protein